MPTRRSKPATPSAVIIPGQLGTLLSRRLGRAQEPAAPAPVRNRRSSAGRVVQLPDPEALTLTSVLMKAKATLRKPRLGNNIHVSDLISKCARKKAIVEINQVPLPVTRLSLTDALTFRQGEAIHDVIKERSVTGAPSLVWGRWKCQCGSLQVETPCVYAEVDQTVICEKCETGTDTYEEAEFIDSELKIVGHPDLILYLTDLAAFYVTELKSISHEQFKELVRPKPEHVIQALFYWFLMRRAGKTMVDTVSLFYVTKGYVFKGQPYKEFTFSATANLKRLEPYLEDARAILEARKSGTLPPRTMCASKDSPDARACEVSSICFRDENAGKPVTVSFAEAVRFGRSSSKAK